MAGDITIRVDTDLVVAAGGTTKLAVGSFIGKHNCGLTDGAEQRWQLDGFKEAGRIASPLSRWARGLETPPSSSELES